MVKAKCYPELEALLRDLSTHGNMISPACNAYVWLVRGVCFLFVLMIDGTPSALYSLCYAGSKMDVQVQRKVVERDYHVIVKETSF